MKKPICGICATPLIFRRWSKRKPARSEALAECPAGCGMWQIRYADGRPTSDPYQVKQKPQKTEHGSWRLAKERKQMIVDQWGSVQHFLDYAPIIFLICNTQQYKP